MRRILKKNFFVNLLVFMTSTVVTLFICEFFIRSFFPQYKVWEYTIPMVEKDQKVTGIPDHIFLHTNTEAEYHVEVKTNIHGFRDVKDLKNITAKDILLAGDSFSFGYGVGEEERFGNLLEKLMGDSVLVYNIAFPRSDFRNYQKNIEYARDFNADAKRLILGVCMENDLVEYQDKIFPPSTWSKIKLWFHKNSSLYAFVGNKIHTSEPIENFLHSLGVMNDNTLPPLYFTSQEAINSSVQQLEKTLQGMDALVVIIPSRLIWVPKHQVKALEVHHDFVTQLQSKSMNVLDLKTVFESISDDPLKELHYDFDGHWNVKGHEVASQAIFEKWITK